VSSIGKYIEEANAFFKAVAEEIGNPDDKDQGFRVSRAFLRTLRDHITVEESMHLISQLPMILKGIYVDGWKITSQRFHRYSLHDFLEELREQSPRTADIDFGDDIEAKAHVIGVIRVLKRYVSEGEIRDIRSQLPEPIAELFE
jgi:uncharacterized protein (DUF2267 family)